MRPRTTTAAISAVLVLLLAAVAYLCSADASYTTGASFVIDGGMLLMAAMANQLAH